jgi:plasmid stability protein
MRSAQATEKTYYFKGIRFAKIPMSTKADGLISLISNWSRSASEFKMADLLIRDIDTHLKRQIEERAQKHNQSLSDEAKSLIRRALNESKQDRKLGSEMFDSILPEDRGDDLVFEYRGNFPKPPDFE